MRDYSEYNVHEVLFVMLTLWVRKSTVASA